MSSQSRPIALFVLALVPFWPPANPPPAAVERPPAAGGARLGPSCAPLVATREVRREAASCLMRGQGMWIYEFDKAEGGDPHRIVDRMLRMNISYVLIRAGSSNMGFYAQDHLDALLPVAHAHGLKVLVWDFPYLRQPTEDARRAVAEMTYTTPDGHRADGFVPDIEEPAQGVELTREKALHYAKALRKRLGQDTVVIATIPRPTPPRVASFPYAELAPYVDAFAPMVYWGYEDPAGAVERAIVRLRGYGSPVIPVGQAYDMRPEGGPAHPPAAQTRAFMRRAWDLGAPGVSFWSWQHAAPHSWKVIRDFGRRYVTAGPAG